MSNLSDLYPILRGFALSLVFYKRPPPPILYPQLYDYCASITPKYLFVSGMIELENKSNNKWINIFHGS